MHSKVFTSWLHLVINTFVWMGVALFAVSAAQANMLVSPVRVQLDDSNTSVEVTLRNPSDGPRTYRLMWVEKKMLENGSYVDYKEGEKPEHNPASPYLRLSPRQVTVAPKTNQRVRVQYRPSPGMKKGEYRSHLLFKVVSDVSEPYSTQEIEGGDGGISVILNMQLSVAIPVIVKHGVTGHPTVTITDVEPILKDGGGKPSFSITLQRSGEGGSYGRVVVDMQVSPQEPVRRIGLSDNVSIYAESNKRKVLLGLADVKIPKGAWVRVAYEGTEEFKGLLWDEQVFQIR